MFLQNAIIEYLSGSVCACACACVCVCVCVFLQLKSNQSMNMKFEYIVVYKNYLGKVLYWALWDQDQGHYRPSIIFHITTIQTVRSYNSILVLS